MSVQFPAAVFFGGTPSPSEILVVLVVVLLLFGAKRLPEIARNLGKSMESFRKAARDVTDEIMHAEPEEKPKKKSAALPPPDTVSASADSHAEPDADADSRKDADDDGEA